MKKKKSIEFNFVTFIIILVIIFGIVFVIARNTGNNIIEPKEETIGIEEQNQEKEKQVKLFSKDVITLDEGIFGENWQIVENGYGSIIFYVQGPKNENSDGTYYDIRINIYVQESDFSNQELRKQMLEDSVYEKINYNQEKEINSINWMEFSAEKENTKAKIWTIIKDGYMYAIEINGEENLYKEYYEEAMKIVNTVQVAERVSKKDATDVIYKYDNIANINTGGPKYLLSSFNMKMTEQNDTNIQVPEEYSEYTWTGIKYSDFENEMKKYMTEEVIKEQFSEFVNIENYLYMKDITGNQVDFIVEEITPILTKGNETTFEVSKTEMNLFQTIKQTITVKNENGKLVVSNVK